MHRETGGQGYCQQPDGTWQRNRGDAFARLAALQERLRAAGVTSLHLHLAPGAVEARPASEVANGVADFVEAYLVSQMTPTAVLDAVDQVCGKPRLDFS